MFTTRDGEPEEQVIVYVGHLHGQTDRYIEVIAAHQPPRRRGRCRSA